tara:strand:+ start:536 stop:670 length:135 start_codon:yes stop_codon:yes gene_type:complete
MGLFQKKSLLDLFKKVVNVTDKVPIFSTLLVMRFAYLRELIDLI